MKITVEETKTRRYLIPDFSEEIDRGIALLDEKVPDWAERINLNHLDMASPQQCVLGQLFMNEAKRAWQRHGYLAGKDMLGLNTEQSEAHGFNVLHSTVEKTPRHSELEMALPRAESLWMYCYSALAEQWIQRIKERRR